MSVATTRLQEIETSINYTLGKLMDAADSRDMVALANYNADLRMLRKQQTDESQVIDNGDYD